MYPTVGMKKPMNMFENPITPDIRRMPPRFKWSKKFWQVDTGRTMLETEHYPQFVENAVLAQSRDYNKTIYGQQSHRDVVNKAFRPPLLNQDDYLPLSRQPRKIVVPRVNPGTADTHTVSFAEKMQRPNDIFAKLTDRVKKGDMRPSFYMPLEFIADNPQPDLKFKQPSFSADAGVTGDYGAIPDFLRDNPYPQKTLDYTKILTSVDARANYPVSSFVDSGNQYVDLQDNTPRHSYTAGITPISHIENFEYIRDNSHTDSHIKNTTDYSINSGMNTLYTSQNEDITPILDSKFHTPLAVINPTSNVRTDNMYKKPTNIQQGNPNISYVASKNLQYKDNNYKYMPKYREQSKAYARQGLENRVTIPTAMNVPQVKLRAR